MITAVTKFQDAITMDKMLPYDLATIISISGVTSGDMIGNTVMRTASQLGFEVMDLTLPKAGNCWTDIVVASAIVVALLLPGSSVVMSVATPINIGSQ